MTTTFSERDWKKREATLGDPAEGAFEVWCQKRRHKYATYGLRRPDVDLSMVPAHVRYTPDFLTQFGLVEVQGCGRDATFKFKHEKMEALDEWHWQFVNDHGFGLYLWLWNQPLDEGVLMGFDLIASLCADENGVWRTDGVFDGHKQYAALAWNDICKNPQPDAAASHREF